MTKSSNPFTFMLIAATLLLLIVASTLPSQRKSALRTPQVKKNILAMKLISSPRPVPTPLPTKSVRVQSKNENDRALRTQAYTVAHATADCESGHRRPDGAAIKGSYRIDVHNPTSSASGKYQFIDSTWTMVTGLPAPAAQYPEHVQDDAFKKLYNGGDGLHHWSPSLECIERTLNLYATSGEQ